MSFFEFFRDGFSATVDLVSDVASGVAEAGRSVVETAVDTVGDVGRFAGNMTIDVVTGAVDVGRSAVETTVDTVSEVSCLVGGVAVDVVSGVVDGGRSVVETAVDTVGDVGRFAGDVVVDGARYAYEKLDEGIDYVREHPVQAALVLGTIASAPTVAKHVKVLGGLVSASNGPNTFGAMQTAGLVAARTSNEEMVKYALGAGISSALVRSGVRWFIDNHLRDTVVPVRGSVLYCDLGIGGVSVEHSGIYVGDGMIIHLDGDGWVEMVTATKFLARLGGINTASTIYVSCDGNNPAGDDSIAQRAESKVGCVRDYNLFLDNCHQFTSGCITGNFDNSDNFLTFLEATAEQYLSANRWRVWK